MFALPPPLPEIVDATATGEATKESVVNIVNFTVLPIADTIAEPKNSSYGVEDKGPVAFGATLADANNGIRVIDDEDPSDENTEESETISKILLFPQNITGVQYAFNGTFVPALPGQSFGFGTAIVDFDDQTQTYTITSSIITNSSDFTTLTQAERKKAEDDIRATLETFEVEMGPEHTDLNGIITVTVTNLDVNTEIMEFSQNETTFDHKIIIQATADTPSIFAQELDTVKEDAAKFPLNITVRRSADEDGSEILSVRITVPSESNLPIGQVVGNTFSSGVNMTYRGDGVYLITVDADLDPAAREAAINSFFSLADAEFKLRGNWSGCRIGEDGIKIEAISTESASGKELADGTHGGDDNNSQTEISTVYIDICATPVGKYHCSLIVRS
jgi:hypothetical protein